jgi:hypothetical protein
LTLRGLFCVSINFHNHFFCCCLYPAINLLECIHSTEQAGNNWHLNNDWALSVAGRRRGAESSRSDPGSRVHDGPGLWSRRGPLRRLVLLYRGELCSMAGNFWQRSHYLQWILDKQDLLKERQKELKFLSEEEYWKLQIFFYKCYSSIRWTSQVKTTSYCHCYRWFQEILCQVFSAKCRSCINGSCVCIFGIQVEEFGVVSNTRLISAATSVLKTRFSYAFPKEFPYRMNHVSECEFHLWEPMDCGLIV